VGPGFRPEFGCRALPARCIWQGSGFAADQTNAMLAVVRADDESLVLPQAAGLALSVARPLPTETASLGFGGSPVGGGDKNSRFAFFGCFYVGVVSLPSACASCCRNAGRPQLTAAYSPFLCRLGICPVRAECSLGVYTTTPSPNRAHSGSHAETRGGFPARDIGRVDRVNSLGTQCIVTFGTAQFDEPLAVAAAHHGGNTDFA